MNSKRLFGAKYMYVSCEGTLKLTLLPLLDYLHELSKEMKKHCQSDKHTKRIRKKGQLWTVRN